MRINSSEIRNLVCIRQHKLLQLPSIGNVKGYCSTMKSKRKGRCSFPKAYSEIRGTRLPKWDKILDHIQTGIDVMGLVPGFGELFDAIDATIYLSSGDCVNAGFSRAIVSFAGWAATGGVNLTNKVYTAGVVKIIEPGRSEPIMLMAKEGPIAKNIVQQRHITRPDGS